MTFKNVLRGLSLGLLLTVPVAAQNGENYHAMSNSFDVVYGGLGAGGTQTSADGVGVWLDGEEMVGNTLTTLADYGYRQAGFGNSECVLGAPPAGALDFPAIVVIEYDGMNGNTPDVFVTPTCLAGGGLPGLTTGGALPFGTAPATSVSFLLFGLPTGAGLPSSTLVFAPENGFLNNGATATLIAAGFGTLPIASTGFCWVVDFLWAPSALPSLDNVDGWWHWQTNSSLGNQYWGWSNDELNLYTSNSVATDAGLTAAFAFFSNLDYEYQSKVAGGASMNTALAPLGSNGTGPYAATVTRPACNVLLGGATPTVNGGFNIGRNDGFSITGVNGTTNVNTGLSNQNPAAAGVPIAAMTLGWHSQDNRLHPGLIGPPAGAGGQGGTGATWFQVADSAVFGLVPGTADADAPVGPQSQRVPGGIEFLLVGWPQPVTIDLLPVFLIDRCSAAGNVLWPDPYGFPGGTFGIASVVGLTAEAPIAGLAPVCAIGSPIVFEAGILPTVNAAFTARGFFDFSFDMAVGVISINSHMHMID